MYIYIGIYIYVYMGKCQKCSKPPTRLAIVVDATITLDLYNELGDCHRFQSACCSTGMPQNLDRTPSVLRFFTPPPTASSWRKMAFAAGLRSALR